MSNEDYESKAVPPFSNQWHHNLGRVSRYRRFTPVYLDRADYETNVPSYYDYLAEIPWLFRQYDDVINQLLRREVGTSNTPSINLSQDGNWEDVDDIIISGNVNISSDVDTHNFGNIDYPIPNGTTIKSNGVWSPDYVNPINGLFDRVKAIEDQLGSNYKSIDTRALNVTYYNGWELANDISKTIYPSYIKSFGQVIIRFNTTYSPLGAIVNKDVENNVRTATYKSLTEVPKSAIIGFTFNREFLPDELKDVDFSTNKIASYGDASMGVLSMWPDPNSYPGIATLTDELGNGQLVLKLIGVSNGYATGSDTVPIGTSVTAKVANGFLFNQNIIYKTN